MKWCAISLLAVCSPWLWADSPDSSADSPPQTCVDSEQWKRLTTIFHRQTDELSSCKASLTQLNKQLPTASKDSTEAETSNEKASESLQEAAAPIAHDWWVLPVVGAGGAFLLGLVLGVVLTR